MDISDAATHVSLTDQRAAWSKSASTRTGDAVKGSTGTSAGPQTGNAPLAVQGLKRDIAPTYMAQWANPRLMRPESHLEMQNLWDKLQACLEALAKRLLQKSLKSETSEDLLANEMMKWRDPEDREGRDGDEDEDEDESPTAYQGYLALDSMATQDRVREEWVASVAASVNDLLKTYCGFIRRDPEA